MKKIIWKLLELVDSNYGYATPIQKRFKRGYKCKISYNKKPDTKFDICENVTIIETARYDYLVENDKDIKCIVYHFELT